MATTAVIILPVPVLSRAALVASLVVIGACARGQRSTGGSGTAVKGSAPPAASQPRADRALLKRLCDEATCAGPMSRIAIYAKPDGKPAVYLHKGDLQACSHPPFSYYDATGKRVLVQAEHPVASPEEAEAFAAERDGVLKGLTEKEELFCKDYR